jgi:hypothetical protein
LTIGHLAVLLLLFFSIENNVEVSLGDPGSVNTDVSVCMFIYIDVYMYMYRDVHVYVCI